MELKKCSQDRKEKESMVASKHDKLEDLSVFKGKNLVGRFYGNIVSANYLHQ